MLTEIYEQPEHFDPATQKVTGTERIVDEEAGTVTIRPVVVDLDADELAALAAENAALLAAAKAERKAEAAAQRYAVETGGLTLGTLSIGTDRESQALINGAYVAAKNGVMATFDFKAADGWHAITAAAMIAIGEAVAQHVQACFSRERSLAVEIEQADIDTIFDVDINSGWPSGDGSSYDAVIAYRELVQRRAAALAEAGDVAGSLSLLQEENLL